MLIVVAPSSIAIWHTSAVNSMSARVASIGENSTSSTYCLACATAARAWPLTSSRVVWSWYWMWMSDVEMNVWIRGRVGVLDRVPGGVDVGHVGPRQARDHRALDGAGDLLHGLEVARRGDRKARLDHVDAQPRELLGDLQLLLRVQRDAGRLLAVTQSRVEDQYFVGGACRRRLTARVFGLVMSLLSVSISVSSRCWFRGYVRPPTRYSPRGGRRRSRRSRRSAIPRTSVPASP